MPEAVTEEQLPVEDQWEVAAIVKKRTTRRRQQYLVRWKNFGPEDDTWMDIDNLEDCAELVRDYEVATGNLTWQPPASWAPIEEEVDDDNEVAGDVPGEVVAAANVVGICL